MNLSKLQNIAEEIFNSTIKYSFGEVCLADKGWAFKGFDRATKRAGVCCKRLNKKTWRQEKYISLSKVLMMAFTEEEAINTLTHEVAHAIDMEYRGDSNHDIIWQQIHQSIGGTGDRCYTPSEEVKAIQKSIAKYEGVCTKCGKVVRTWQRKPKYFGYPVGLIVHTKCGGGIKINQLR